MVLLVRVGVGVGVGHASSLSAVMWWSGVPCGIMQGERRRYARRGGPDRGCSMHGILFAERLEMRDAGLFSTAVYWIVNLTWGMSSNHCS